jgi:hypothetical protein
VVGGSRSSPVCDRGQRSVGWHRSGGLLPTRVSASAVLGRRAECDQLADNRIGGARLRGQCLSESGGHGDLNRVDTRGLSPHGRWRLMRVGSSPARVGTALVVASLATAFAIFIARGTAVADECGPGLAMDQSGACIPATIEENPFPPEWVQASGGDAVDPDSPTSVCQNSPPCPEGKTILISDCECPPR